MSITSISNAVSGASALVSSLAYANSGNRGDKISEDDKFDERGNIRVEWTRQQEKKAARKKKKRSKP